MAERHEGHAGKTVRTVTVCSCLQKQRQMLQSASFMPRVHAPGISTGGIDALLVDGKLGDDSGDDGIQVHRVVHAVAATSSCSGRVCTRTARGGGVPGAAVEVGKSTAWAGATLSLRVACFRYNKNKIEL